jgi:hypothetical protein
MKLLKKNLLLSICLLISTAIFSQRFEAVKEIPDGKALVYIYRSSSMLGAAVHYTVNANDVKASEAHLKNGTYFVYFADPGRYTFWAQVTNTRRETDLDVEAGKTYYVKGDCCSLVVPPVDQAEKEIVKCKFSKIK